MIEGLKIEVKGSELQSLFRQRGEWHNQRERVMEAKRLAIQNATEEMKTTLMAENEDDELGVDDLVSNTQRAVGGYGRDTAKAYLDKAVHHRRRGDYLRFLADHLSAGETYILTEQDLYAFEIVQR